MTVVETPFKTLVKSGFLKGSNRFHYQMFLSWFLISFYEPVVVWFVFMSVCFLPIKSVAQQSASGSKTCIWVLQPTLIQVFKTKSPFVTTCDWRTQAAWTMCKCWNHLSCSCSLTPVNSCSIIIPLKRSQTPKMKRKHRAVGSHEAEQKVPSETISTQILSSVLSHDK